MSKIRSCCSYLREIDKDIIVVIQKGRPAISILYDFFPKEYIISDFYKKNQFSVLASESVHFYYAINISKLSVLMYQFHLVDDPTDQQFGLGSTGQFLILPEIPAGSMVCH